MLCDPELFHYYLTAAAVSGMDPDSEELDVECSSSSDSDSEESLCEEEIEDGGSREMILIPKKRKVSIRLI